MTRVVITAKVKNVQAWEAGYREKAAMLRQLLRVSGPVQFCTNTDTNEICVTSEPDDLKHYLSMAQTTQVADAMDKDGVIRETVQFYILDKAL